MKLLSRSILFRHGARGPGDSELKPWDNTHPIVMQWKSNELENLSAVGIAQAEVLGNWFAKQCKDSTIKTYRYFSSKSDRAAEFGEKFLVSFQNEIGEEFKPCSVDPYSVDPDNYFRRWKIHDRDLDMKEKQLKSSAIWTQKVIENRSFLLAAALQLQFNQCDDPNKILWNSTHVTGLLLVELYWPENDVEKRDNLRQLMTNDISTAFSKLACWVWEQRFISSDLQVELGGWLFLELIQKTFDSESCSINIFAAHDYTIISVLAAAGVIKTISNPVEWAAHILLELWESSSGPTLRLKYNSSPFSTDELCSEQVVFCESTESTLAEWTMSELKVVVDSICGTLISRNVGLPPGFDLPSLINSS